MIEFLELPQASEAILTLGVVGVMFILFVRESFPTEVIAITGVALLLGGGLLPYEAALSVLSNPAPWTIAAMFIIMGALVRTGALETLTGFADGQARTNPALALAVLMAPVPTITGSPALTRASTPRMRSSSLSSGQSPMEPQ